MGMDKKQTQKIKHELSPNNLPVSSQVQTAIWKRNYLGEGRIVVNDNMAGQVFLKCREPAPNYN